MIRTVSLENAAVEVCDASAIPPLIYQLPPEEGRMVLEQAQNTPVFKYPSEVSTLTVNTGKWGPVKVSCLKPQNITGTPHVIFYIHGAGWVFGSFHTHEKLISELGARTNSIVIFPEYSRSPEAKYPTALEQCYRVLCTLPELLSKLQCDANLNTLTVAGDSVGGTMATVMTILSKYRNGPKIHKQLLYYPVTNACFNTDSYCEFAVDYYLYREGMMWFWNQYLGCLNNSNQTASPTVSPLRATPEQLCGLPAAMILNGEADVLRDEGEAYARQLREAGVSVTAIRFQAIIHDFVMLNALDQTNACRAAMDVSTDWINRNNWEQTV